MDITNQSVLQRLGLPEELMYSNPMTVMTHLRHEANSRRVRSILASEESEAFIDSVLAAAPRGLLEWPNVDAALAACSAAVGADPMLVQGCIALHSNASQDDYDYWNRLDGVAMGVPGALALATLLHGNTSCIRLRFATAALAGRTPPS